MTNDVSASVEEVREYVKEPRGDKRGEAIDIYHHHIDRQELIRVYLAYIPKLGV